MLVVTLPVSARGLTRGLCSLVRPARTNSSSTPQFEPTDVPTRSAPLSTSAPLAGFEYRLESAWLTRETSALIVPATYGDCAWVEIPNPKAQSPNPKTRALNLGFGTWDFHFVSVVTGFEPAVAHSRACRPTRLP